MIFWFFSQIVIALQNNNISWEAHIGGFLIGYLVLRILIIEDTLCEKVSNLKSAISSSK